jgi:hypothetical protein
LHSSRYRADNLERERNPWNLQYVAVPRNHGRFRGNPLSALLIPANTIKAIAWRAVPWVTTTYYQTAGDANTSCTGSGSWVGNIWQGSSSCSTQYTPTQNVPINWQHVTVYNLVETSDSRMVIACTRNWALSKCSSLVPGNVFPFEYKKGKIEITGDKVGKEKEQTLSFDIVSNEHR